MYAFDIAEIDITRDAELFARYRHEIPVLLRDGTEIARGRITDRELIASAYFAVMMKCPRRFCCQQDSFDSAAERRFLALADDVDAIGADAEADQIVLDRVRPPVAERQVVFARPALVGMPFDRDPGRRPPLHPLGILLQRPARVVANRRFVEIEEHVAERTLGVELNRGSSSRRSPPRWSRAARAAPVPAQAAVAARAVPPARRLAAVVEAARAAGGAFFAHAAAPIAEDDAERQQRCRSSQLDHQTVLLMGPQRRFVTTVADCRTADQH